jgi:arylsulfatase A-like enzyme
MKPNVILVLTDDQGYGDLGCTGNPWIRTPNIDTFAASAVRCRDFHVAPLCTPTRGGIMTGRRPLRNGAWATCWGRSILRRDEATMADVFAAAGYRTGMFGKWHLGDNYPYRPHDRGFQHVVAHKGGGVGQTPDFWANDYFDDTYFHNGKPVSHEGYCTDIWFDECLAFVEANRDRPFFCYLATNAPHSPYLVSESYRRPYENNPAIRQPGFYGMIENIDENFGRLRRKLQDLGLEDNTILIFMTDNGSSGGCETDATERVVSGYNAGMRGKKGSYFDGGHRVPFFVRWPDGKMAQGRDVDGMVMYTDLLPTFIELCSLPHPAGVRFDGISAAGALQGRRPDLPDRVEFLQYRQGTQAPEKWTNLTMTPRWRLLGGRSLFDIEADPGQQHDVAASHPEVVARLRAAHDAWWSEVSPGMDAYAPVSLGNPRENPTRLNSMDVMGDVAWHQVHVLTAKVSAGRWAVAIEKTGRYRFSLRRWPEELGLPIAAALPEEDANHLLTYTNCKPDGWASQTVSPAAATLCILDVKRRVPVRADAIEVVFEESLDRTGVAVLDAAFEQPDGSRLGAYYVTVERL